MIEKVTQKFKIGEQEDSQEFLAYLLDVIHEDLNRVRGNVDTSPDPLIGEDSKKLEPEEMAKISWKNYLKKNKSVVVDIFQGQIRSSLECQQCNNIQDTFDPMMYLSLPFPASHKNPGKSFKLEDLFEEFTKKETLDESIDCSSCKKKTPFTKKIDIWKSPNILIIHFKRFSYSKEGGIEKIENMVEFELKNMSISKAVKGYQLDKAEYNLFAICV